MTKKASKTGRKVSLQEMAAVLNVERNTLSRWITVEGCPADARPEDAGGTWQLDTRAVIDWLIDREASKRVAAVAPGIADGDEDDPRTMSEGEAKRRRAAYDAVRARADAALRDLDLAERRGLVVQIEEVAEVVREQFLQVRGGFGELGVSFAAKAKHESDPVVLARMLDEEVDAILGRLTAAEDFEARAERADADAG